MINDRLENIVPEDDRIGAYDGFVSRATPRLGPTLELAAHLVHLGERSRKAVDTRRSARRIPAGRPDGTMRDQRRRNGQNVVAKFVRK